MFNKYFCKFYNTGIRHTKLLNFSLLNVIRAASCRNIQSISPRFLRVYSIRLRGRNTNACIEPVEMKQLLQNIKTGKSIVEDVPAPTPREGQALVKVEASLVSAGTER